MIAPQHELCLRCHELPKQRHIHGPVGAGHCLVCHEPHHSAHVDLLKTETVAELCGRCHTGVTFMTAAKHEREFADQSCTECHSPHSSDLPDLERKERTGDDVPKPERTGGA